MIDTAPESGACNTNQCKTTIFYQIVATATITQTGILLPIRIAGTKHFLIQFDENVFALVPFNAFLCTWKRIRVSNNVDDKDIKSLPMCYLLIIGTVAVCRIAVPVWPESLISVLPHPAITPLRPVRSIFDDGKQIGRMWLLCNEKTNKCHVVYFSMSHADKRFNYANKCKPYEYVVGTVNWSRARS